MARNVLQGVAPALRAWDRRAAGQAAKYLAISSVVRDRIRNRYGIEADVVHPPVTLDAGGELEPVSDLEPGYYVCVSRLLPYKKVDLLIDAFQGLKQERLVIVGDGPEFDRLARIDAPNVRMLRAVTDASLRWLYQHCRAVVAASYEDYGLTPLEGYVFGRPSVTLRWGGFLDTVVEGVTGVFFDEPSAISIQRAIHKASAAQWDTVGIQAHAATFDEESFQQRVLSALVSVAQNHW
jgi:glycosyltransferase involved in cell wall biosynthesis